MDPPPLTVSLLGGFKLRYGSETVPIQSGRVRALIAWLALHRDDPQPRLRVAAALWPDSAEGQARTNLRNLIHQLRRAFPEIDRYLDCAGPALAWRAGAPVAVDVAALERAVDGDAGDELERALERHAGPLLPDCYESWVGAEQDRVRELQRAGLEALLYRRLERGDHASARAAADRILSRDPTHEAAHRARIEALAAIGDRAGAARAYAECVEALRIELGVEPSDATRAAYRAAVGHPGSSPDPGAGALREPEEAGTEPGTHGPTPAGDVFVGRVRELAVLEDVLNRALETGTRMVWVTGEPGIGKTRLMQAFTEGVERRGVRVVRAQAYPTLGALAYGPVIEWLRAPAVAAGVAAAPAAVRGELRRLLPELPAPEPISEPAAALTEAERRQRLHDAVIRVLGHRDGPSVLLLDDLQWGDAETLDLLSSVVARSARRVLVVATVRTGEADPDHPLVRAGARLDAAGRLDRLELEPLDPEATAALVRSILGDAVTDDEARALHRETEGNPLFIVETARSGRRWGPAAVGEAEEGGEGGEGAPDVVVGGADVASAPGRSSLSPRIRTVIEGRLALLSREARTVTRVAATIGREFGLPLLLAASPFGEEATLRGLEEAWRRRLVRERGDGSWDFSHGKIRDVAYRTTSPLHRRSYHARIAVVLEATVSGGAPDSQATLDQVALHHDRGGEVAKAVDWYRRAAAAAMQVSGLDSVRQLLGRALELVVRLPPDRDRDELELELWLTLGSVRVALEGYARAGVVEAYERARALCGRLDRPVTPPILRALALAALARGDLRAGSRFGEELSEAAERDSDPVARVEGAYVSGVMAFWKGDLPESERRLTEALEHYRPERQRDHVRLYAQDPNVVCLSRLAWTLWHRGRVADAHARRDRALVLAERQGDPLGLAYALWFTLFIPIEQADLPRLESQTGELKRIAALHRLDYVDAVADGFLGYLAAVQGDARGGIDRMRATLTDPRWKGMEYVLKLQTLYLIARAAAAAGDHETARVAVAEALDYLHPGPSIWEAPLLGIRARVLAADDRTGARSAPAFRAALELARRCGSAWTELAVAVDRGRWTLERRGVGEDARAGAARDLERALGPYAEAPPVPAVAAGRIIVERLTTGGGT